MIRKQVDFDDDVIEFFTTRYGGASVSWVVNLLMREFMHAHKETPQDYARIGAEVLKKKIDTREE